MANRNRKAMNRNIFQKLADKAEREGVVLLNSDKARWLHRLSQEDADMMARADFEVLLLSRQMRALLIRYKNFTFFVAMGFPDGEELASGLRQVDLTPAIFAIAQCELVVPVVATGSEILNAIEDIYEDEDYDGHSLETIMSMFARVSCVSVDPLYEMSSSTSRIAGSCLARTYYDGPFELSSEAREKLASLFEAGGPHIPYGLVLQGFLSFSWSAFFIELYRCVEQLYSVPRLIELTEHWEATLSLQELAMLVQEKLSWRPREDDSLVLLLQKGCSTRTLTAAARALKLEVDKTPSAAAETVARSIYKLRNEVVHFRPSKLAAGYSAHSWDDLICSMIDIVSELYDSFGEVFHKGST